MKNGEPTDLSSGRSPPAIDTDVIAGLVAGLDRGNSPLGPIGSWPPALRVAFRTMAAPQFPMFIAWGEKLPYLYNAACLPIVGSRHPQAFGRPFGEVWPEVSDDLSPLLHAALDGAPSYHEKLTLTHDGVPTPTWFTFSYSPPYAEHGAVRGVLSVALEETGTVVAARRQLLRQALDKHLRASADPAAMADGALALVADYLGDAECSLRSLVAGEAESIPDTGALSPVVREQLGSGQPMLHADAPAWLAVPLRSGDTTVAVIEARCAALRHWTAEDVATMREAGDRIRLALQRLRAEAAVRRGEEELRRLADAMPVLISYVDADERYRFGNRAYEAWFGRSSAELIGKPIVEVVGAAAYARLKPALERAFAGEPGMMEELIPYRDGGERYVQFTYVPRRDGTGAVQGYYALVQDIGNQKQAEAALRRSERRLSEVLESVSDGFFALDSDWRFSVFNRACELAFATSRDAVLGKVIWDVFPATQQPAFAARLRAVAETETPDSFEADSIVTPGALVEIRAAPKEGGGVAVAFSDITQRKRAEDHRQLLVNELNHRVKNTLSVVQAIAAESFKSGAATDAARKAFEGRLTTLAAAHTLLTEQNWENALLADVVVGAVTAAAERPRFTLSGPAIALQPQTAVSLALALHELCTNAVKYGALSLPSGHVDISWHAAVDAAGAPRLRFLWAEFGGPPVSHPATRGFGSRLLERSLARELRGTVALEFAPDGLLCRIDAPLPIAA